jgi:dipeptidyl aminopeptidase/acylaminoacyl peptidase
VSRLLLIASGIVLVAVAGGCGGSGGGPGANPPASGETVSVGTLQVGVASAAAFKTLTLSSPGTSRIAFTVLYGTKIVRLEQMGYGKIAFVSYRDGNDEVCVMNADGSGQTNLTNNAAGDYDPSWSPDGRKIAFRTHRDANAEVYVMDADGSGQTNLTNNAANDYGPSWSPDGRKIAFYTDRDGNREVYVMNADGSGQTNLTNSPRDDESPSWSPDGRKIAFAAGDVYVMNADGSGQTNLTNNAAPNESPSWSPDGRKIAFVSYRDGNAEVYVMNADGSGQTNLTNNVAGDYWPSWSPDGRKIAFIGSRPYWAVYVMNTDGSQQTNVTNHAGSDLTPAWCPAPSVVRSLIGAAGSDGGGNPPFGTARPLVIVGIEDGVVSATTIALKETEWPSLKVAALQHIGTYLAGVEITGNNIRQVVEDVGRGLPARIWPVYGAPMTGGVLIFFSGDTGKVSSVLAGSDTALADTPAQLSGGRVLVRGSFTEVYSAKDGGRNLVSGSTKQVALDSRTGEVVGVG